MLPPRLAGAGNFDLKRRVAKVQRAPFETMRLHPNMALGVNSADGWSHWLCAGRRAVVPETRRCLDMACRGIQTRDDRFDIFEGDAADRDAVAVDGIARKGEVAVEMQFELWALRRAAVSGVLAQIGCRTRSTSSVSTLATGMAPIWRIGPAHGGLGWPAISLPSGSTSIGLAHPNPAFLS